MTLQDQAHDPRISKPHPHKKGWRCEIKTPSGAWRHGPTAPTEAEAEAVARQTLAAVECEHGQTVGACIDLYLDHHREKGSRIRTQAALPELHLVLVEKK